MNSRWRGCHHGLRVHGDDRQAGAVAGHDLDIVVIGVAMEKDVPLAGSRVDHEDCFVVAAAIRAIIPFEKARRSPRAASCRGM